MSYTLLILHTLFIFVIYVFSLGKLCILDYGLMTSIDENRRLGLLEYVAHLLAKV